MNKELDEKLTRDFPNLYADRYGDMMSTCMVWGFECSDGWFQLIYNLSAELEPLIVRYKKENPNSYVPKASQVKEKYGTLRFYMDGATDEMCRLIDDAEDLSEITCEICGRIGKTINNHGWYMTICRWCNFKLKLTRRYRNLKWTVQGWFKR